MPLNELPLLAGDIESPDPIGVMVRYEIDWEGTGVEEWAEDMVRYHGPFLNGAGGMIVYRSLRYTVKFQGLAAFPQDTE